MKSVRKSLAISFSRLVLSAAILAVLAATPTKADVPIECTGAYYGKQYCVACYVWTAYGWVLSGVTWS
jgi:hypothetical protein